MNDVRPSNGRVGVEHDLKVWPEFYAELASGNKPFEIRKDDRGFRAGDILLLREWNPRMEAYTGNLMRRRVTYVLSGIGLQKDFIVMGLAAEADQRIKEWLRSLKRSLSYQDEWRSEDDEISALILNSCSPAETSDGLKAALVWLLQWHNARTELEAVRYVGRGHAPDSVADTIDALCKEQWPSEKASGEP